MSPLEHVDRLLLRLFTRKWEPAAIESYAKGLRLERDDGPVPAAVTRTFQSIDTKAAALLTHTSLMVAALGVATAVVAETTSQQAVIIAEIVAYLGISLLCLRCISVLHEIDYDDTTLPSAARDELILRQSIYRFCNRATIYMTALVLVSLPILFLI